ncbi:DUF1801 domain-containing protein [Neptunicoccus sediminis]|uniref:DUF1801 domain-containing protein n=1 Tax=Neptunicoccus sediminis TaxID=1892596 RepID=UPI000845C575|nr:DUF1801 domain-containing protein [Neptunicoccus sediminis]
MTPLPPPEVQAAFDTFAPEEREKLHVVRRLIFQCAVAIEAGPVTETLRWGQPAYLVKRGSSLRLGIGKTGQAAIFAHCQSSIISDFATVFGADFKLDGNRAVYLEKLGPEVLEKLQFLILHGLQYKRLPKARLTVAQMTLQI